MGKAIGFFLRDQAQYLFFPISLYGEQAEKRIRQEIIETILKKGIKVEPRRIFFINGVEDTRDEIVGILKVLAGYPLPSIIVVADRYHLRRSLQIFRRFLPETLLYNISSACKRYDPPFHPHSIRRLSISAKWIHILWNLFFYTLNPILLKKGGF